MNPSLDPGDRALLASVESLTARYRELIARAEALLVDMEKGLSRATSDRRRSPHHPGDRPGPYRTWAGSAGPHG